MKVMSIPTDQNAPPRLPADGPAQEALHHDIRLLDNVLGEAIRRLAGPEAFTLQEEVRSAAGALRLKPSVAEARRLYERLAGLSLPALRTLIRSFSVYFDLINLAEQQARVRANRLRLRNTRGCHWSKALRQLCGNYANMGSRPARSAMFCNGRSSVRFSRLTRAKRAGVPSSKSSTPLRSSSIAWNTAASCRGNVRWHCRPSRKPWRLSGFRIPSGAAGPRSWTRCDKVWG